MSTIAIGSIWVSFDLLFALTAPDITATAFDMTSAALSLFHSAASDIYGVGSRDDLSCYTWCMSDHF